MTDERNTRPGRPFPATSSATNLRPVASSTPAALSSPPRSPLARSPLPSPSPSVMSSYFSKPPPSPIPRAASPAPSSSFPPPRTPLASSAKAGADDLTSRLFRFFSTATTESLSAVGVGLAATTYFVLGRVGLVLIGAFGGIALFVAWETRHPDATRGIRGETSSELLARVIEYRKKQQQQDAGRPDAPAPEQEKPAAGCSFDGFRPETRQALDSLVDAVLRDYVKWWYQPIVPSDQSFPLSCRRVLTSFLVSVSHHLSRKRPADAFLDFLTNSSSIVIVFFSELATAFAEHAQSQQQQQQQEPSLSDVNPTVSAADAIYGYLSSNPESNLANLLSQRQQAAKFRMVAEDLLSFLERQTYDCEPAHAFLREILAGAVLETTLQTCSKPEWINGWIVYMLEAGEPNFSQAIDVGMQTRADSNGSNAAAAAAATAAAHSTLNHASVDIDGNVGNISLAKSSRRSSFEAEKVVDRARRKDMPLHRKQLSRADEEMEEAMEEMKRMNQMIAAEDARRAGKCLAEAEQTSAGVTESPAPHPTAEDTTKPMTKSITNTTTSGSASPGPADETQSARGPPSPPTSSAVSPKASFSVSGDERARAASTPITPRSSLQNSPNESSFESSDTAASSSDARTAGAKSTTAAAAATTATVEAPFTSFDQIVPPAQDDDEDTGDSDGQRRAVPPPLTLHNAQITIHDEPVTDKGRIKSKPAWDFLIQIEPANSHYPGWMIVRKYSDFEKLHEVLRRIAAISGATAFTEQHSILPNWKMHTRASLRGELERYVRDACWYQPLAESEGMKRFLDKDTNMPAGAKSGFQAFEAMGKNMLDVLSNAPKGVAEGGKVMVGGVTGVFGSIGGIGGIGLGGGPKKHATSQSLAANGVSGSPVNGAGNNNNSTTSILQDVTAYTNRLSVSSPPRTENGMSAAGSRRSRDSMDSQRSASLLERRMSYASLSGLVSGGSVVAEGETEVSPHSATIRGRSDLWGDYATTTAATTGGRGSQHNSRASSRVGYPRSPSVASLGGGARLPATVPGDILDEAARSPVPSPAALASANSWPVGGGASGNSVGSGAGAAGGGGGASGGSSNGGATVLKRVATSGTTLAKQFSALTEAETRVAVELVFAVINELYTLSSAWNIRRTLLAAAKSFLLRPGNPSLASIQSLMQKTVLDAHTTDAGIAALLRRLQATALPTEAERAAWPAEMTADEKERLRVKARRLLIQSGVPAALMGVMGQSATADAMGRIFDSLQIEEVARGLLFGLLLQAARIVTH